MASQQLFVVVSDNVLLHCLVQSRVVPSAKCNSVKPPGMTTTQFIVSDEAGIGVSKLYKQLPIMLQ